VSQKPAGGTDRTTLLLFLVVTGFGGLSPVLVRVTLRELSPMWGGFMRFTIAALILAVIVLVRHLAVPRGRALLGAVLFGSLGVGLSTALIYRGIVDTSPGVVQVILSLVPLTTLLFAVGHRLEPFRPTALLGALIAVIGVGVVFNDQLSANVPVLGMLSVLAACLSIAETTVILKAFPRGHPLAFNAVALPVAATIFLVATIVFGEPRSLPRSPEVWLTFVWLTLVGTIGVMTLFVVVIRRLSASVASYQFLLMPLVTVAASSVITGERVSPAFILGAAIVLFGVYVGIIRGARGPASQIVPEAPIE
jgi:drug/metabolite transporter (DMT)-like permease